MLPTARHHRPPSVPPLHPLSGAAQARDARLRAPALRASTATRCANPKVIVEHVAVAGLDQRRLRHLRARRPRRRAPRAAQRVLALRRGQRRQRRADGPAALMCRHTVGLNYTAIGIEHVGFRARRRPRQRPRAARLAAPHALAALPLRGSPIKQRHRPQRVARLALPPRARGGAAPPDPRRLGRTRPWSATGRGCAALPCRRRIAGHGDRHVAHQARPRRRGALRLAAPRARGHELRDQPARARAAPARAHPSPRAPGGGLPRPRGDPDAGRRGRGAGRRARRAGARRAGGAPPARQPRARAAGHGRAGRRRRAHGPRRRGVHRRGTTQRARRRRRSRCPTTCRPQPARQRAAAGAARRASPGRRGRA